MVSRATRSNAELRKLLLRYLYDRNATATSARGKRGAAVKISDMRRELKAAYGLSREEVVANLNYLISQGYVQETFQDHVIPTDQGRRFSSSTPYYSITASGIDKIEGPSEYTPRDRFAGIINVNASNRSTVTVGDGNQISAQYADEGEALADLCHAIKHATEIDIDRKKDAVADIDAIQSQLARSRPIPTVIQSAWSAIEPLGRIASLTQYILAVAEKLRPFIALH